MKSNLGHPSSGSLAKRTGQELILPERRKWADELDPGRRKGAPELVEEATLEETKEDVELGAATTKKARKPDHQKAGLALPFEVDRRV